ncbi:hypothetical protein [Rhizobium lentis]|uniref:hypothetical protein n=1 Tax=Rhizobium lentis TaxID=1138194 RepID=UPI00287FC98C|nr:hypothetical protein [Rhizobium lentis]
MNTEIKPAARRKQPIEVGIEQRRQREIVRQMEDESYTIVLKVDCAARLFNSLDPTPFRERDLDPDAERFIVEWAQEAPRSARLEIVVQLPVQESAAESAAAICEAIRHNFGDRAAQSRRELRELLREGRRELIVGIPALALSIVFSQLIINAMGSDTLGKVLSESLLIFGWVANWRPLEIFLYDWWSIALKRRFYRRLAAADVKVVAA